MDEFDGSVAKRIGTPTLHFLGRQFSTAQLSHDGRERSREFCCHRSHRGVAGDSLFILVTKNLLANFWQLVEVITMTSQCVQRRQ